MLARAPTAVWRPTAAAVAFFRHSILLGVATAALGMGACQCVSPPNDVLYPCGSNQTCDVGFTCATDGYCHPNADGGADAGDGGLCGVSTCSGCCQGSLCIPVAQQTNACGTGGAACQSCSGARTCQGGACVNGCGPGNCFTGCCQDGGCLPGTSNAACGSSGVACQPCGGAGDPKSCVAQIGSGGACLCPSGCTDARGSCQSGTSAGACGQGGAPCVDCGANGTCNNFGTCVSGSGDGGSDGGASDAGDAGCIPTCPACRTVAVPNSCGTGTCAANCAGAPPCVIQTCVSQACQTSHPTGSCDDGNPCTYGDHCDGAGNCVGSTPVCPTNDPCNTYFNKCNEQNQCGDNINVGATCGVEPSLCGKTTNCYVCSVSGTTGACGVNTGGGWNGSCQPSCGGFLPGRIRARGDQRLQHRGEVLRRVV
jgi:hypothetical protein